MTFLFLLVTKSNRTRLPILGFTILITNTLNTIVFIISNQISAFSSETSTTFYRPSE